MPDSIDIENIFNHWISTSDRDFDTMNHLYFKGFQLGIIYWSYCY